MPRATSQVVNQTIQNPLIIQRGAQVLTKEKKSPFLNFFSPVDEPRPDFRVHFEQVDAQGVCHGICHNWRIKAKNLGAAKSRARAMIRLVKENCQRDWKVAYINPVN